MTYLSNPQHRDRTKGKSQWTITLKDEIACFNVACAKHWTDKGNGWGLHYSGEVLAYLGVAQDHQTRVFIAKFVENEGIWHGYPADHQTNRQDVPAEPILAIWMKTEVLRPAKIRKIMRGQPCRP